MKGDLLQQQLLPGLQQDENTDKASSNNCLGDLRPTEQSERTFTGLDIASLWFGIVVSVSTYYVAGSLVELGMSWWQGLLNAFAANSVQFLLASLLSHPGTRYGIPFPVLCRSSFGPRGAHFAAFLRSLISCGWYGIDVWIGGQALYVFIDALCNGSLEDYDTISWIGISAPELGCFLLFWLLQLAFVCHGVNGIRYFEKLASPLLVVLCSALLAWAYVKAGGFGEMLSSSSQFGGHSAEFWNLWIMTMTANTSSFAAISLNISDISRYTRSQTDQVLGQLGIPFFVGAVAFIGLAVSSATEKIFGYVISNPVILLSQIGGVWPTLLGLFGVTLATLTTNVANVVAPATTLMSLFPKHISFLRGALITAGIGVVIQPWRIYQSSSSLINEWLLGYAAIIGPLIGIIIIDYYILQHCLLDVNALYSLDDKHQKYYYYQGFNITAFAAFFIGFLPNIPGFLYSVNILDTVPSSFWALYQVSLFSGGALSGLSYYLISKILMIAMQKQDTDAEKCTHN